MNFITYKGRNEFNKEESVSTNEIEAKDSTEEMIKHYNELYDIILTIKDSDIIESRIQFECMPLISEEISQEIGEKVGLDNNEANDYFIEQVKKGNISTKYVKLIIKGIICKYSDGSEKEYEVSNKEGYVELAKFGKGIKCPIVEEENVSYEYGIESLADIINNPEVRFGSSYPYDKTNKSTKEKGI